jgi:hypothetical protein
VSCSCCASARKSSEQSASHGDCFLPTLLLLACFRLSGTGRTPLSLNQSWTIVSSEEDAFSLDPSMFSTTFLCIATMLCSPSTAPWSNGRPDVSLMSMALKSSWSGNMGNGRRTSIAEEQEDRQLTTRCILRPRHRIYASPSANPGHNLDTHDSSKPPLPNHPHLIHLPHTSYFVAFNHC